MSDDPLAALFSTFESIEDLPPPPAPEGTAPAAAEESVAEDAGGEAPGAPPEDEVITETPPIVVELSEEVETALRTLDAALGDLGKATAGFLATSHLEVAELADELEPVHGPDDLSGTTELVAAWSRVVDANLDPFREAVSGCAVALKAAGEYVSGLKRIFEHAVVPEPPAEAGEGT